MFTYRCAPITSFLARTHTHTHTRTRTRTHARTRTRTHTHMCIICAGFAGHKSECKPLQDEPAPSHETPTAPTSFPQPFEYATPPPSQPPPVPAPPSSSRPSGNPRRNIPHTSSCAITPPAPTLQHSPHLQLCRAPPALSQPNSSASAQAQQLESHPLLLEDAAGSSCSTDLDSPGSATNLAGQAASASVPAAVPSSRASGSTGLAGPDIAQLSHQPLDITHKSPPTSRSPSPGSAAPLPDQPPDATTHVNCCTPAAAYDPPVSPISPPFIPPVRGRVPNIALSRAAHLPTPPPANPSPASNTCLAVPSAPPPVTSRSLNPHAHTPHPPGQS